METEILNKILVQVEKIGTDLTDFKEEVRERFDRNEKELAEFKGEMCKFREEVYARFDKNEKELKEFKDEMYDFREEMYKFKDEMYDFRGEMYKFIDEMYDFREEMYRFKDEMYDFRTEVYDLFDKNTQEISDEIHEVARMMSRKIKQVKEVKDEIRQELKAIMKINEKEHKVFESQIEKLQCIEEYIPKLYFKLIEIEQAEKITA